MERLYIAKLLNVKRDTSRYQPLLGLAPVNLLWTSCMWWSVVCGVILVFPHIVYFLVFMAVYDWRSPVYFLLRGLALQHQLLVGDLQLSGRHVQLFIHFGVLLVHLPQHFQLLGEVLPGEKRLILKPVDERLYISYSCSTAHLLHWFHNRTTTADTCEAWGAAQFEPTDIPINSHKVFRKNKCTLSQL